MDEKAYLIHDWLQCGTLGQLIAHAQRLNELNALLQPLLPELFQGKCRVLDFKQGCLVLGVTDVNALTLLRFEGPELLSKLRRRAGAAGISSMTWRLC